MRHDRIPLRGGDENDALTRWRYWLHFRPGQRKRIKRTYNKRQRKYMATQHLRWPGHF